MATPRKLNVVFGLIVALFALYAAVFIYRTSFVLNGERYYILLDDPMISMRYARNLAESYGLVWNPGGAPVEGFTDPLWVVYMAGWHLLPIAASQISLAIQVTGLVLLVANLFLVRKLAAILSGGAAAVELGAVLLTALYEPLSNWSLRGAEVGVLALLVSLVAVRSLRGLAAGRAVGSVYLLLGVGVLIRLDAVVIYLAVWGFLLVSDRAHRGRHLIYGLTVVLGVLAAQTALRHAYYGDVLPNTYYLKMTGFPWLPRITRGLVVFGGFVFNMNLLLFIGVFAVLRIRRDRTVLFLCCLFCSQVAYSIYVGGDVWEGWGGSNRYISVVMPVFIVLLCYSLWAHVQVLARRLDGAAGRRTLATRLALLLFTGALGLSAAVSYHAWGTSSALGEDLLAASWIISLIAGICLSRQAGQAHSAGAIAPARAAGTGWILAALFVASLFNLNAVHVPAVSDGGGVLQAPKEVDANRDRVRQALAVRDLTTAQATVAVVWAGILPYFADRQMVDLLGKNDRTIARESAHLNPEVSLFLQFGPGHLKWDYGYSLGKAQPDVIVQLWPGSGGLAAEDLQFVPPDALPYLEAHYTKITFEGLRFYARTGSPHVRWEAVGQGR